MRVLFLVSGNGGNLKFLHQISNHDNASEEIKSIEVIGAIADRQCGALNFATENNLISKHHSFKRTEEENKKLIDSINELHPDIVITNVHKIISHEVLIETSAKFLNVHYSILPAFAGTIGMQTVDDAINAGSKFLGSTCHVVTEELDAGPILSQSIFPFTKQDGVYNLVFRTGALSLLGGILCNNSEGENLHEFGIIQTNFLNSIGNVNLDEIFDEISSK